MLLPIFCFSQQTIYSNVNHNGISRDYILYVPQSYDSNVKIPLVFSLHGKSLTNVINMNITNFNDIADTANFIVVYPQGELDVSLTTGWNVGWSFSSGADDIGFIDDLIEWSSDNYNVNTNRVYSTGMSNGGFMSYHLACNLGSKIAAIASVMYASRSLIPEVVVIVPRSVVPPTAVAAKAVASFVSLTKEATRAFW